jgi:hypothetical protein
MVKKLNTGMKVIVLKSVKWTSKTLDSSGVFFYVQIVFQRWLTVDHKTEAWLFEERKQSVKLLAPAYRRQAQGWSSVKCRHH